MAHRSTFVPRGSAIRRKVIFGFGFLFVTIVAITVATWKSTMDYRHYASEVADAHVALERQSALMRLLEGMESEQRNVIITGDAKAVARYETLASQVDASLRTLEETALTEAGGALPMEQIRALVAEVRRRHDEVHKARKARGFAEAVRLYAEQPAQRTIEQIQGIIRISDEWQSRRLAEAMRDSERNSIVAGAIIGGGGLLSIVVLLVAVGLLLRDVDARHRAEVAVADQAHLLSSIIDAIPDFVFVKDLKGRYILHNRAHRLYLNAAYGETVEGRTDADFFPPEIAERIARDDRSVLDTGEPILDQEEPGKPNTKWVWLETNRVPLRELNGRMLGLVSVCTDITARKEAGEKLKRFAAELERSNSELQNFASVASHDLQEPLRKIQAFADRLRAKSSSALGPQGLDYLSRMQNAAVRMQTLIQDLLQLSRVASKAQPFEPCDLATIMKEVLSDLEVRIEQNKASVNVGELPIIDADRLQMRQLFQNLVANALKFHKPDMPPEVTVSAVIRPAESGEISGAREGESVLEMRIADNGIGFEQKFAEQIFAVFQRLHGRDQYEGTGIGLAVVRKIADRHGGSIRAESGEGLGATFIVVLPLQHPRPTPTVTTLPPPPPSSIAILPHDDGGGEVLTPIPGEGL